MAEEPRKSKLIFLHKIESKDIEGGKAVTREEYVVHGPKGLAFKYYYKDDKTIEKFSGKQNPDGDFTVNTTVGDKKETRTLSKEQLLNEISKVKHLKFIVDYLKSQKGGARKKVTRKSKKGSKKGSRKVKRSRSLNLVSKMKKTQGFC